MKKKIKNFGLIFLIMIFNACGYEPLNKNNSGNLIVISEKVVRDDIFTSIHIDEYSLDVRDTKLGTEELTDDKKAS